MVFTPGKPLLEALVLAAVSQEPFGLYGYKLQKYIQEYFDISESAIYTTLKALQKKDCLESYNIQCNGRNRTYYKITESGLVRLNSYQKEWHEYSRKIHTLLTTGSAESPGKNLDK